MKFLKWIKSPIRPFIWPAYSISILNSAAPLGFWIMGTPVQVFIRIMWESEAATSGDYEV